MNKKRIWGWEVNKVKIGYLTIFKKQTRINFYILWLILLICVSESSIYEVCCWYSVELGLRRSVMLDLSALGSSFETWLYH